ncbi:MAG: cupin domain-containing protein [Burkholderiales bacterium]|nr:cupin domain-containing protein [Burkholderiales bacterium]
MPRDSSRRLLGGATPAQFLARHWQKRPLLVRGAVPGFAGAIDAHELMRLACDEHVESRIVVRGRRRNWQVLHGPFRPSAFRSLGERGWTLLVQDLNHHVQAAHDLLRAFRFLPNARLDDVMASYAAPGGGVGPHVDSYDVFLLQGPGIRRWRIGRQRDLGLVQGAPLKLLRRFAPTQEWRLGPGDMLYLPPSYAHDGTAMTACMTYSIGFRAPAWQELTSQFLAWLQDRVKREGLYTDPDLTPTHTPGRLGAGLIDRAAEQLARIRWSRADVSRFLGCYLTEPKPSVFFTPPAQALGRSVFERLAWRHGVALDRKSRMLYNGREIFLNGELEPLDGTAAKHLRALADAGSLRPGPDLRVSLSEPLYAWYRAGFIHLVTGVP